MKVPFKIVNLVATAALDRSIDLESLRELFPQEVIHDPAIYGGRVAYFKSKDMQGKITIFWSGKMISVGTQTVEAARKELKLVARTLMAKLKTEPKIQNIVATANLHREMNLEEISLSSSGMMHVTYEPEQFPAAIIRFNSPVKATVLLFSSGKVVITGTKDVDELEVLLDVLMTRVLQ